MPEVLATAVIPAPVERTWAAVRDFDGLPAWHPGIATSELEGERRPDQVGAVRRLGLGDGAVVREVLVALDDGDRHYTYEILESPFPVRLYRSTVRVVAVTTTGESFVEWSLVFDCDEADADRLSSLFRDDVFATGLQGLTRHLANP